MPLAVPAEPQVKVDGERSDGDASGRACTACCGWKNARARGQMQVNVKVSGVNVRGESCYHGDTLDMESVPAAGGVHQAGRARAGGEGRGDRIAKWASCGPCSRSCSGSRSQRRLRRRRKQPLMTAEEQAAAMDLLRDPRLLERVLEDFERCGAVGEETNKKVSYLAAVSRLLAKPLAVVVQSSSSAGKSSLMEAVLDFMPEEHRESYTAMTGQALFYMGQKNLKHKILAIAEQQGAEAASYPLKLLQSEGKLNIASTGKDPVSGKHVTHEYTVEGPVMIFLTTTAHDVDEELMNRCLVLAVNEDREQTRAIHRKQREAQTLEGLKARMRQNKIVRLHRNAQRLLRPVAGGHRALEGPRLPRRHDAHAARPHEVPHADPGDHAAAISISARSKPATEDGETLRVHRGHRGRREAGLGACQPCADAFARRRADADAPPAAADRQDGDGGMRAASRSSGWTTASRGPRCGSSRAGATRS